MPTYIRTTNDENGKLWMEEFFNGEIKELKIWHENGQLSSHEFYKNGKREGVRKRWHKSGQLMALESYRNGSQDGEQKDYYGNGYIWAKMTIRNGHRIGEYKFWREDGDLALYVFYLPKKCTQFSMKKKNAILSVKSRFHVRANQVVNTYLIFDLAKIVQL
jgi:antitoxin component YwqK of YwqJK toxin-antitoxin module